MTEPEIKDLTLYYGADIYENLPLGHHPVTKEEAKEILADMHKKGYVHNVLYMFGKKSGAFVMCNCDREVCAVVKGTRILGPGINCEKRPGGDQARQKQMSGRAGVRNVREALPLRRK